MSGLVVKPINQDYRMMAYSIHLEGDTLKVDFAKTDEGKPIPAAGDVIVQDVRVIAIIYSDIDATTDEIETKSPQLKGTVHRLIRGELVSNRPVIQELAKQLVELASL